MSKKAVALVGTGNFAFNIAALLDNYDLNLEFCVDEFREEPFQSVPVLRAAELTRQQVQNINKFIIAISNTQHCTAAIERLTSKGVDRKKIIILSDDPSIQILHLLFKKFQHKAISTFCSDHCTSIPQLESSFLGKSWDIVLRKCLPNRPTISLCYYGRGGGFRRHLSPLIPHLERNYNLLTLSDELLDGDAELPGHHLYISSESACQHRFSDLALSAHIFPCCPTDVPRVTFSHVIYDFNLTPDYHAERIGLSDTHYIFASSQPSLEWYNRLIEHKKLTNRLCVIPGGYMHLDENIKLAQDYQGPVDSIIYAPTLSLADYPHSNLATSIGDGAALIENLLQHFPDFKIIFRPHPSDLKLFRLNRSHALREAFALLLELCRKNPRCILDSKPTNYMDSYNRSALMLSDTSSTAMTYAFATGRPVVFYAPHNEQLVDTLGRELAFVHDREMVGTIATSVNHVTQQTAQHLQDTNEKKMLKAFRNEVIFNVGKAGTYFAKNIEYLLKGEKHPDWIYFNW